MGAVVGVEGPRATVGGADGRSGRGRVGAFVLLRRCSGGEGDGCAKQTSGPGRRGASAL